MNRYFNCHTVELGFVAKVNKIEGQNFDCIVIDINPRPFKPQLIFIALSRVKSYEDIRFMPLQPVVPNLT